MLGVTVTIGSVAESVVTQSVSVGTIGVPGVSLSIGLRLSLSRPLAVVKTMVSIGVAVSIGSVASISVRVGSIAIIAQPWVSLRLGLWLTGDEGGKANHKSELHC